ncbi:DUF6292 family protein [Pseudonocardia acaciae]|uniref:DUF6292 family protein n=1 Tax=Pseudonocardia acaciae TaxID=551276 RepID=UPI00048BE1B0|nr:DUF6292 family protein [Pseudonocardia acaciae]
MPQDTTRPRRRATPTERSLVVGYLSAVAVDLARRGIRVRALNTEESDTPAGTLTLDPPMRGAAPWTPTRLRWEPSSGWSASLSHRDHTQLDAVTRYLSSQRSLPTPSAVAHFVAALYADPDTPWACATPTRRRPVGRQLLVKTLSRFAPLGT